MPFWNKRQQRERDLLERLRRADEQLENERQARAFQEFEQRKKEREAIRRRQEIAEQEREREEQEREREDSERREREEKAARMRMVSPETLRDLRELLRTRYELDIKIWNLRKVRKPDRPVVEEKMERSDAVLGEIMNIIQAWDGSESSWSPGEWEQAQEIIRRIEAEGKREWAGNPPWEEN
jgi:hypothetical protein